MSPQDKFQKAKIALLLDEPFFGALLLNLKCKPDSSIKTMATNGAELIWAPSFVNRLTVDEVKTILAHETMHCAMLHHLRRENRDCRAWNVACDHAINLHLGAVNAEAVLKGRPAPFPFPTGALMDSRFANMGAEEIYATLQSEQPADSGNGQGQGQGQGQGEPDSDPGAMGEVKDAPGADDPSAADDQESTWKVAIAQASSMAKAQGKMPGAGAQLVEDSLNQPQNWASILRQFITEACKDDYSWSRPNRRYMTSRFVLPSLHSLRLGRLAVAIDTSGSITKELVAKFMGEVETIAHECRPQGIVIYDCSAAVHSVKEYEATDELPKEFNDGGGTDFRPVFEDLEKGEAPVALVYFTDLCGDFPEAAPGYPVLWAATGELNEAPFGDVIPIG